MHQYVIDNKIWKKHSSKQGPFWFMLTSKSESEPTSRLFLLVVRPSCHLQADRWIIKRVWGKNKIMQDDCWMHVSVPPRAFFLFKTHRKKIHLSAIKRGVETNPITTSLRQHQQRTHSQHKVNTVVRSVDFPYWIETVFKLFLSPLCPF